MIANNVKRMGNSAPFANNSQRESQLNKSIRTKKNSLRLRQPESMNYKDVDLAYKEPLTFHFDK